MDELLKLKVLDSEGKFDLIPTMIAARKTYGLDLTEAANLVSFLFKSELKHLGTPERIVAGKILAERLI